MPSTSIMQQGWHTAGEPPVGRARELAAIDRALRRGAGCLAISGEPGSGKTRLLDELAARATTDRRLVLAGRGAALERDVPFGAIVDALDDHLAATEPRRLARIATHELVAVFPALAALPVAPVASLQGERYRTCRAVRDVLKRLAVERPVVLVLDDLQWIDDASAELLAHLLRRPMRPPLLLALAFRTGQAPAALAEALHGGDHVALTRLEPEEAGALLGDLTHRRRERAYRESGGNPFYLRELAAADGDGVPPAIASAVSAELALLPEASRQALQGAAVAGDPFSHDLVAAIAGCSQAEALEALDVPLIRAVAGGRFAFRQPIVRRAVYELAPATWRVGAHTRAAAWLQGAPPEVLAPHVAAGALPGNAAAIRLLERAAHTAEPATAARWLAAAADRAPAGRDKLRVRMAHALAHAGRIRESRDVLREATPGDAVLLARLEHALGRHREASAVRENAGADPYELAWDHLHHGRRDDMLACARRAHAAARSPATAAMLALAEYNAGTCGSARKAFAEAEGAVERMSDAVLAPQLEILLLLGWYGHVAERFDEGARHLERGLAICRATGRELLYAPMLVAAGTIRAWRGELGPAARLADEALEAARETGAALTLLRALALRGWVAMLMGDVADAVRLAEEAVAVAVDPSCFTVLARCLLGEAYLEAGLAERCVTEIVAATGGGALDAIDPAYRSHVYEVLTRAELACGRPEAAERWVELAEDVLVGVEIHGRQAEGCRARAALQLARGDAPGAHEAALAAVQHAERGDGRIDAARARVIAGRAQAAAGARAEAVAQLEAARAALAACGARRWEDEAARELRRLGRPAARPGRRRAGVPRSGIEALTPRERQVAELVCAGGTNAQIAAELFLSEKTVEGYLANVFAKLGVSTRAAAAAAVARAQFR